MDLGCFCDVHFRKLERLEFKLSASHFMLSEKGASYLLNANRQLQNVTIRIGFLYCDDLMSSILNMIQNNWMLSKLSVYGFFYSPLLVTQSQMQLIVDEHPGLVELVLDGFGFEANNAIWLMCELTSLEKFCFRVEDTSVYEQIRTKMGIKWQSSYDERYKTVTMSRQN